MENKNMEGITQVCESVSNSKGGKIAGLVLGAVGVVGGIAAAVIFKNKKNKNEVEVETVDVDCSEEHSEE